MPKIMKVSTKVETQPAETFTGSWIGRKWQVDGVAGFEPDLSACHVTIKRSSVTKQDVVELAKAHELGHASFFQETLDEDRDLAIELCKDPASPWPLEVDAWIRALNEWGKPIAYKQGTLVLDALGTYAKGYLPDGLEDSQYQDAKDVIAEFARPMYRPQLREYIPEIPDEEPPPPPQSWEQGEGKGQPQDGDDTPQDGSQDGSDGTGDKRDGMGEGKASKGQGSVDDYIMDESNGGEGDEKGARGVEVPKDPNADRWTELSKPEYVAAAMTGKDRLLTLMKANGVKPATLTDLPPILQGVLG